MKKITLFLFLMWLSLIGVAQVRQDTVKYVVGSKVSDAKQELSFKLIGDSLSISGLMMLNCCGEHYMTYEVYADSIYLKRYEGGPLCDCNSLREVNFKIGKCTGNHYKIFLTSRYNSTDGEEYYEDGEFWDTQVETTVYRNYLNDGKRWTFRTVGSSTSEGVIGNVIEFLQGDTIIGNKSYKRIYSLHGQDSADWEYMGAVREADEKVFLFAANGKEERLVFDFSMKVGESIIFHKAKYTVIAVGDTLINNSLYRTHILKGTFGEDKWIEGIGSLTGGLFPDRFMLDGIGYLLLSCYQGDELLYINSNVADILPIQVKDKLQIRNVNGGIIFTIQENNIKNLKLSIYSSQGQCIRVYDMDSSSVIVKGLPYGIYVYRLESEDSQNVEYGKFVAGK